MTQTKQVRGVSTARAVLRVCGLSIAAWVSSAYSQSSDLGRVLDVFNKVQRASQNASKPAPAPPPPTQSESKPASESAPASPRQSPPRASGAEPPPGQYEITFHSKSKLAPGERIEHDPRSLPKRDPRWAANYENFVPPEATQRFADGPRQVVMEIQPSHTNYGTGQALRFKRILSNPYIPTERVDLPNPNWVISPYYAQGFFKELQDFSCRPDGSLYVQGTVGVAADFLRPNAWARGIWRVEPDGKIVAFEVFPASSYMKGGEHTCTVRTCGLPPHAPRERALAAGSHDWAQDKHGNVWGIAAKLKTAVEYTECFVTRFNVDGSVTPIQGHQELCEVPKGFNREFWNPPLKIVYDEARDEMLFVAGRNGGNTDGSWALLKADQSGQVTELLRNWQHSESPSYGPNPPGKSRQKSNQVKERWDSISDLIYDPNRRAVTFETSIFQGWFEADNRRMYEIKGSFSTLKALPLSPERQGERNRVFGSETTLPSGAPGFPKYFGDDQRLLDDRTFFQLTKRTFGKSCFDAAGNRFFMNGTSIRKMDAQGRLSTWVK